MKSKRALRIVLLVLAAGALIGLERLGVLELPGSLGEPPGGRVLETAPAPSRGAGGSAVATDGAAAIEAAFRARRSGVEVEADGVVERLLPDDDEGSPHQRFVVRLRGGRTVLVAHNLDLADRVPLREGDDVRFRGDYEWNDRGGVIHWTHHDPQGRREGGWVEHAGKRYE